MSDKQTITYKIKNQDIELNTYQVELLKQLHDGAPKNSLFKNYFLKKQKGAYLYGKVGRGKTLLMDIFLDGLNISYKKFHYIDLMQEIHKLLEKEKGTKNPIKKIFDKYFSNFRLIFIDEFQVEDIADAMILGDLLMYAIKNNTYLYFTSNAKPSELYKNGLQRQKFLPCIELIETNTSVMSLKGGFDYRSRNIAEIKESFFETSNDINEFLRKKFGKNFIFNSNYLSNNRNFQISGFVPNELVWLSFKDFFSQPTGSKDYIKICMDFEWVFIDDFNICDDDNNDVIRRFISFIDVIYKEEIKCKFFFNSIKPESLYKGEKLQDLWARCYSRIIEMMDKDFFVKN